MGVFSSKKAFPQAMLKETLYKEGYSGDDLLSHAANGTVPLALTGLTSLFGMGRGVTPSLLPPE
jgi:hypothetical protein